jgi:hypothetical protein
MTTAAFLLATLPVQIVAWECSGEVAPASAWTGSKIEIREDRIRFSEVRLRFDSIALPQDEARWFETPTAPGVASVLAWEQFCKGACFDSGRAVVPPDEADPLIERAVGNGSCRARVEIDRDGKQHSKVAKMRTAQSYRTTRSGIILHPAFGADRTSCRGGEFDGRSPEAEEWIDERFDLDSNAVTYTNGTAPTAESLALLTRAARELSARALKLLGAQRPDPATVSSGPDATRLANVEMWDLASLCGVADDEDESLGRGGFPGEFSLAAAAASGPTAAAMASVEARYSRNAWDRDVALRTLGDRPQPRYADALVEVLETALSTKEPVRVSLALRALMKADLAEAKRRAEPLLDDPKLWPSAAGVFVLSDPALAKRLADRDARSEAVRQEVLTYVRESDSPSDRGSTGRNP